MKINLHMYMNMQEWCKFVIGDFVSTLIFVMFIQIQRETMVALLPNTELN